VGSGAGGGPLASRLAMAGHSVLLIEAGDDQGKSVYEEIPAFFAPSSEYEAMSWDFFVRHYPNATQEARNSKATYTTPSGETYIGLTPPEGSTLKGIWYPRAATLGGCTAHNAMVHVYPHKKDWNDIQAITGDASWNADNMRKYFIKMEQNQYLTSKTDANAKGHGFDGWLGTSVMPLSMQAGDVSSMNYLSAALSTLTGKPANLTTEADLKDATPVDLNADIVNRDSTEGFYRFPEAVNKGDRAGSRDIVLATVAAGYPLTVQLNTFVTKIRFSKDKVPVALGVDFLEGSALYAADPRSGSNTGTPGSVNASVEVIISAGTFNTPQILKLSGVGPAAELKKFGIPVVSDLPGVGTNLEDHYEISSIVKSETPFHLLETCAWLSTPVDQCYEQWAARGEDRGPYATNLLEVGILKSSSIAGGERDQLIFGGPISFKGYYQGYALDAVTDTNHWTWAALRAHSKNNAGSVTLKSANPLEAPEILFNYFESGVTANNEVSNTLTALVEQIEFGRESYASLPAPYNKFTEVYPGPEVQTRAQLEQFVKDEAWGHHASGTAKIGAANDKMAVLDSAFRVRGVSALRVVDASALPETPGFFPVASVYMIGEKAADVVLADYAKIKRSKACLPG